MKVILLGEIKGKGGEGDVVDVAQGYAENYLFPKKLAVAATKGNLKQLEERRNNIEKREAVRIADANALKESIDGKSVTVDAKVGDEGVLFGSVTASMVADAIKADLVALYREIRATVTVLVGVTAEEAVEEPEAAAEETVEEAVAEVETEAAAE